MTKHNPRHRHAAPPRNDHPVPDAPHDQAPRNEPGLGDGSRQQSMASHARETRTKMSVGQADVMRLKKGRQPRGDH
jgi:hypothetical protein